MIPSPPAPPRAVLAALPVFAAIVVASALFSFTRPKIYEAIATGQVMRDTSPAQPDRTPDTDHTDFNRILEFAQSDQLPPRVAAGMNDEIARRVLAPYATQDGRHGKSLEAVLAENYTAKPFRDSAAIIYINYRARDPALAAEVANLFVVAINRWTATSGLDRASFRRVDAATPPADYVSPNHGLDISLGVLAGLVASSLIVLAGIRSRRSASDAIPGPGSTDPRRRELLRQRELEVLRELEAQGESCEPEPEPDYEAIKRRLVERCAPLIRPGVHLVSAPPGGFSKLGGWPQLPPDLAWPVCKGQPLAFLAQIDLAPIHATQPSCLPPRGHLFLFLDQSRPWGDLDKNLWRVVYRADDCTRCAPVPPPQDVAPKWIFEETFVTPRRIDTWPGYETVLDRDEPEEVGEMYIELSSRPYDDHPPYQMLGNYDPEQNFDMEQDCQLAAHGILPWAEGVKDDPALAALRADAKDWRLLLQIPTDQKVGWRWGDLGKIYFWVREAEARAGDFSNAWLMFDT